MPITYMTKEGYKKKMEEIAYLESVKRPEISRAIAEARDKGDLRELGIRCRKRSSRHAGNENFTAQGPCGKRTHN